MGANWTVRVVSGCAGGASREAVVNLQVTGKSDTVEEVRALFAAAPDLLAALEWVVTCCDPNNPSEMDDGGLRDQEHAIDRARAAIAKARGES